MKHLDAIVTGVLCIIAGGLSAYFVSTCGTWHP